MSSREKGDGGGVADPPEKIHSTEIEERLLNAICGSDSPERMIVLAAKAISSILQQPQQHESPYLAAPGSKAGTTE